MAGLQPGEHKARPGARSSEPATPGCGPAAPAPWGRGAVLAGLGNPAASGVVRSLSPSQWRGERSHVSASLLRLGDLHMLAVFVQTPAGGRATGLGGGGYEWSEGTDLSLWGSCGPRPSCQPRSRTEPKGPQKGGGFSAHPSQHCPPVTLKMRQVRGKDVMWKGKPCGSPAPPPPLQK